jgi:hypothetical protein
LALAFDRKTLNNKSGIINLTLDISCRLTDSEDPGWSMPFEFHVSPARLDQG